MRTLKLLAFLMVLAMVATACGTDGDGTDSTEASGNEAAQSEGEKLTVVASTTIWGDVVSNVVGDSAEVEVLLPIGADPHDYQLSAAQAATMQNADLVVVNGLALEEGLLDVIEGLEADGANILELAGLLDPIEFGEGGDVHKGDGDHEDEDGDHEDEDGDHEGHAHGSLDPHVWMDPLRVADAAELIAKELANLDASVDWITNATAYADQLRTLDAEVVSMLAAVPDERRKLVTNHEAFGYFADRYEFEVVGTVIPGGSTLADPSSVELAELVEVLTEEGIEVIFAETTEPVALAEAIAAEVERVAVVELFTGSLGESGSGAETYVDFIRSNASQVAATLT